MATATRHCADRRTSRTPAPGSAGRRAPCWWRPGRRSSASWRRWWGAASTGPARAEGLAAALAVPGAQIHVYGKLASRPGRKMGHITALGATLAEAEARAQRAAAALRI